MAGSSKQVADSGRKLPPAAGKGRPKGAKNKVTKDLKAMILGALSDAGGQEYLKKQAEQNPASFLTLIGRVLPKEVTGKDGQPLIPEGVRVTFVAPK